MPWIALKFAFFFFAFRCCGVVAKNAVSMIYLHVAQISSAISKLLKPDSYCCTYPQMSNLNFTYLVLIATRSRMLRNAAGMGALHASGLDTGEVEAFRKLSLGVLLPPSPEEMNMPMCSSSTVVSYGDGAIHDGVPKCGFTIARSPKAAGEVCFPARKFIRLPHSNYSRSGRIHYS